MKFKLLITQVAKYKGKTPQIFNDTIDETDLTDLKGLYARLKGQGKIAKMYRDNSKGEAVQVGYILTFQNTDDDGTKYTEEQWIELLVPKKVTKPRIEYFNLAQLKNQ